MAVPLQVKVCMSGFSVDCGAQTSTFILDDQNSRKGMEPSGLQIFTGELDMFIYRICVPENFFCVLS